MNCCNVYIPSITTPSIDYTYGNSTTCHCCCRCSCCCTCWGGITVGGGGGYRTDTTKADRFDDDGKLELSRPGKNLSRVFRRGNTVGITLWEEKEYAQSDTEEYELPVGFDPSTLRVVWRYGVITITADRFEEITLKLS